jgi:hypothetical protein
MNRSIKDFKFGDFVQSTFGHSPTFVGNIVGVTVNPAGEPIFSIEITVRKFVSTQDMIALGFSPVDGTAKKFWKRAGGMHPSMIVPINKNVTL